MQTWLPVASFEESAKVLDLVRLGKQRVENYQLTLALLSIGPNGETRGSSWSNHPCARMWRGYVAALYEYQSIICRRWRELGRNDTCWNKTVLAHDRAIVRDDGMTMDEVQAMAVRPGQELWNVPMPPWLGDENFHRSHRSNLLRKDPDHYRKFWPDEYDGYSYVWPVP